MNDFLSDFCDDELDAIAHDFYIDQLHELAEQLTEENIELNPTH